MRLTKHWFLIALLFVLAAAWAAPGPDAQWIEAAGLKTICIIGIFLISGLGLPVREMGRALGHWRLHLFAQGFNLGLVPLFFLGLDSILGAAQMDSTLRQGFLILACVPTTITSCVALTKAGGGNEAGAVCNATLGNLLGVFLSPALVYALAGRYGGVEFLPVIRKLSLMVVLPIGVGQLLRLRMEAWAVANRKRLGAASQVLLLAIIYIVFIKTFSLDLALPMRSLAATVALALGAHVLLLCLAWPATALRRLGFSRGDRIAALFCSTQKTVALGIPLITILYEGDPRAGLLAVPLLCYHPLQLIADSVAASMLAGRGRESR